MAKRRPRLLAWLGLTALAMAAGAMVGPGAWELELVERCARVSHPPGASIASEKLNWPAGVRCTYSDPACRDRGSSASECQNVRVIGQPSSLLTAIAVAGGLIAAAAVSGASLAWKAVRVLAR